MGGILTCRFIHLAACPLDIFKFIKQADYTI